MENRAVPRTMSSQHPDNANKPDWAQGQIIHGEDEVYEAYYAFHSLQCQEVMWDAEGKDVDLNVVRKLLGGYPQFFKERRLGREIFLTYRVPNPSVEVAERKVFAQTLESIPLCYDVAKEFYGDEKHAPIIEVVLPFTTSASELIRTSKYYRNVVAREADVIGPGGITVSDWIGNFNPKKIEVIPLVEDLTSLFSIDQILLDYLKQTEVDSLRVFVARSDPALNYGLIAAILLSKIALSKIDYVSKSTGISMYPMIGVGSLPFRGHLTPYNIESFLNQYRGICTVTIQSAFKYDYPHEDTLKAILELNEKLPYSSPLSLQDSDYELLANMIGKLTSHYERALERIASVVNDVALLVPSRRSRKLHIGLFGYSRRTGPISLPRAIPFAAALYSLGIPPEFLGLSALNDFSEEEYDLLTSLYPALKEDLRIAAGYVAWNNINLLLDRKGPASRFVEKHRLEKVLPDIMAGLNTAEAQLGLRLGPQDLRHRKHENMVNNFLISMIEGDKDGAQDYITEAGRLRRSLG